MALGQPEKATARTFWSLLPTPDTSSANFLSSPVRPAGRIRFWGLLIFTGVISVLVFVLLCYSWSGSSLVLFALKLPAASTQTIVALIFLYILLYLTAPGLTGGMQDIVPGPRIEPRPPALGARTHSLRTTREFLILTILLRMRYLLPYFLVLQVFFFFFLFGHTAQFAGSQFPDQGLNLGPSSGSTKSYPLASQGTPPPSFARGVKWLPAVLAASFPGLGSSCHCQEDPSVFPASPSSCRARQETRARVSLPRGRFLPESFQPV